MTCSVQDSPSSSYFDSQQESEYRSSLVILPSLNPMSRPIPPPLQFPFATSQTRLNGAQVYLCKVFGQVLLQVTTAPIPFYSKAGFCYAIQRRHNRLFSSSSRFFKQWFVFRWSWDLELKMKKEYLTGIVLFLTARVSMLYSIIA